MLKKCEIIPANVRMESWDFAYSEKKSPGVIGMSVKGKQSKAPCNLGESFGFGGGKTWVDKGCRADFDLDLCPGRIILTLSRSEFNVINIH